MNVNQIINSTVRRVTKISKNAILKPRGEGNEQ